MGAFFHAVRVFFEHLADVRWDALALALACHVIKLLFRARAWQNIVRAAYPETRLRYRSAFGAYVAGVGINSIVDVQVRTVEPVPEPPIAPTIAPTPQPAIAPEQRSVPPAKVIKPAA